MNLGSWGARVANWKNKSSNKRSLEWNINHLHSEVSEVFEALRDIQDGDITGKNPFSVVYFTEKDGSRHPEGFGIELADVVLVALYIAEVTGVDIEEMMEVKMKANEQRRAR